MRDYLNITNVKINRTTATNFKKKKLKLQSSPLKIVTKKEDHLSGWELDDDSDFDPINLLDDVSCS